MRISKLLTVGTLLLQIVFSINPLLAKKPPKWLNGDWYGIGYQLDGMTWKVNLKVEDAGLKIDYPSLGCGGQWSITDKKRAMVLVSESLEYGKNKCDAGVTVRITKVTDNEINLSFLYVINGGERMVAFANVVKVGSETVPMRIGYYQKVR